MKTIKLILTALLLICIAFQLSAQRTWKTVTKKYENEEYIIKNTDLTYAVTNAKYELAEQTTTDAEFEGETIDDFEKRRESLRKSIYNVLDEILQFSSIPVPDDFPYRLSVLCYFDSHTKDYIGVYFVFPTEIKDYMTLERINQAEQKLSEKRINAGRTYLFEDKPYFAVTVNIRVGK